MSALKPGTPCSCSGRSGCEHGGHHTAGDGHCCADSARFVTVPNEKLRNGIRRESMLGPKKVSMCTPCADHAEHETWPCYCGHVRGTHPNSGRCQGGEGDCNCQEYREGAEPEQDAQVSR